MIISLIGSPWLILLFLLHPSGSMYKKHNHRRKDDHETSKRAKRQYLFQSYSRSHSPFLSRQVYNPFFYKQHYIRKQPHSEAFVNRGGKLLNAAIDVSETKSIKQKEIPLQQRSSSNRCCGEAVTKKKGSFKIDDGQVLGFGTYEIMGDEVIIDLDIKISKKNCNAKPTSKNPPVPVVGEETTKPKGQKGEGNETTQACGGGDNNTKLAAGEGQGREDVAAFEAEALKAHNIYRTRHDAPPMTLNKEMSASAEEWAKELGENDKFQHSPNDKRENLGENIASWCDAKPETATKVTQRWYDEVCNPGYDFSRNDMNWASGHFTQVVWRKSTEMGIGFYDKKRDDGFVCRTIVARYKEPGNKNGTFLENVKKGSFEKSKECKQKY